jgi:hypothetical protein
MTASMDDLLRATVHDLAGEARLGADLAAGAISRGRRLRRRRRVGLATAAVLLAGVTAAPYAVLRGSDGIAPPPSPAASVTPSPAVSAVTRAAPADWYGKALRLPGGWTVTSIAREYTETTARADDPDADSVVLDRATGRYRTIGDGRYSSVWPSPRGDYVAVSDGDRRHGEIGLVNLRTGKVRWIGAGWILDPQWSPDGRRLLLTGTSSFTVLDAATGAKRRHARADAYECTDVCLYTWLPTGTEVALPLTDPAAPRSEAAPHARSGVQVFSAASGRPVRTLPLKATPVAWSPDGTRALVLPETSGPSPLRVAHVATGELLGTIPFDSGAFTADGHILGWDSARATLHTATGAAVETLTFPAAFTHRAVTVAPL